MALQKSFDAPSQHTTRSAYQYIGKPLTKRCNLDEGTRAFNMAIIASHPQDCYRQARGSAGSRAVNYSVLTFREVRDKRREMNIMCDSIKHRLRAMLTNEEA